MVSHITAQLNVGWLQDMAQLQQSLFSTAQTVFIGLQVFQVDSQVVDLDNFLKEIQLFHLDLLSMPWARVIQQQIQSYDPQMAPTGRMWVLEVSPIQMVRRIHTRRVE